MTTRHVSAQRKRALMMDLLAAMNRGALLSGTRLPSLATLALRYGLSKPSVLDTVRTLIKDGSVTKGASGYFAGQPLTSVGTVVVLHDTVYSYHDSPAVVAFTRQVTQHGGTVMLVRTSSFLAAPDVDDAPLIGVFCFLVKQIQPVLDAVGDVPVVQYLEGTEAPDIIDPRLRFVDIDNADGGRIATKQLLWEGIDSIAFLGIHRKDDVNTHAWSRQRASGWRDVMLRRHPNSRLLELTATQSDTRTARIEVSALASARRGEFTACVGADDAVIITLANELKAQDIPTSQWPVMVGFEGLVQAAPYVLASVRPDWCELGSRVATLLLNSARGRETRDVPVALTSMAPIGHG